MSSIKLLIINMLYQYIIRYGLGNPGLKTETGGPRTWIGNARHPTLGTDEHGGRSRKKKYMVSGGKYPGIRNLRRVCGCKLLQPLKLSTDYSQQRS